MTYLTEPDALTFPTPLGISDFDFAREFSQQQKYPNKARQVYLNTLAVRAVNFYCHNLLKIETELEKSQSWDKNARFLMNVADLKVKGLGTLECRPVLKGDKVCPIPPEVRTDRIGYVIVEIDEKAKTGTLINFVKNIEEKEVLPLVDLPDIEGLIDLFLSEQPDPPEPVIAEEKLSELKQQLEALFSNEWDEPEKVLASSSRRGKKRGTERSASSTKSIQELPSEITVRKAKSIKLKDREFALIIKIEQKNDNDLQIFFEVKPQLMGLPAGLELALLSPSGHKMTSNKTIGGEDKLQIPRSKPASMQLKKLQNLIERQKFYQLELTLEDDSYTDSFPSNC
ncbi:MAG: DUF1822 family protein [Sphaerospermopsis sp. SIO1G1]|nr:DUF1822 family protein [Sphaerospermopsis sp. SIO1G1]